MIYVEQNRSQSILFCILFVFSVMHVLSYMFYSNPPCVLRAAFVLSNWLNRFFLHALVLCLFTSFSHVQCVELPGLWALNCLLPKSDMKHSVAMSQSAGHRSPSGNYTIFSKSPFAIGAATAAKFYRQLLCRSIMNCFAVKCPRRSVLMSCFVRQSITSVCWLELGRTQPTIMSVK